MKLTPFVTLKHAPLSITDLILRAEQIVSVYSSSLIYYIKMFWNRHGKLEVEEDILLAVTWLGFFQNVLTLVSSRPVGSTSGKSCGRSRMCLLEAWLGIFGCCR